jgi:integrase
MLSACIDRYLAVRRTAGYGLETEESLLRSFERFATARRLSHVRVKAACEWAGQAPSPEQRELRLDAVRRLAKFAAPSDDRHQVPPRGFFGGKRRQRKPPRIYTPHEVATVLRAALRLGPEGSLWPRVVYTLLALLYVTGLRISEATRLRICDVTAEGLLVRKTKFRKSRLLPLHRSTEKALQQYLDYRSRFRLTDDHLFVSKRGRPLDRHSAANAFCAVVAQTGLLKPGRPRPRLHCFRHGFAVRVLEQSPEGRDQVGRHLLALSTYLGHTRIADTYWYLEATPKLMKDIAQALECFLEGGSR